MGFPKFVEITRTQWKGKRKKDPSITQMLHANVVEGGEFCSVAAIMFLLRYYNLAGVQEGPLFRQFRKDRVRGRKAPEEATCERKDCKVGSGTATCSKWYRSHEVVERDGKEKDVWSGCATLSEETVRKQLMVFFKEASIAAAADGPKQNAQAAVRLAAATPHTFRASMVGWAARSYSPNAFKEAMLTGRWKAGYVFCSPAAVTLDRARARACNHICVCSNVRATSLLLPLSRDLSLPPLLPPSHSLVRCRSLTLHWLSVALALCVVVNFTYESEIMIFTVRALCLAVSGLLFSRGTGEWG